VAINSYIRDVRNKVILLIAGDVYCNLVKSGWFLDELNLPYKWHTMLKVLNVYSNMLPWTAHSVSASY